MERRQRLIDHHKEVFLATQKEITATLLGGGATPNSRAKTVGIDMIRVASNEWEEGGNSALMLDADGGWSVKFDMSGYSLQDPSFDDLVLEYARITDPRARTIELTALRENDDFEAGSQIGEAKLGSYVEQNKEALAGGLVNALQRKLKALQEGRDTNPNF